jgi:hypothetical protein
VKAGDSWPGLAKQYWKDPELGEALALFSGHAASQAPPAGETLHVPGLVRHRLQQGETLASLSRQYFDDVAYMEPLVTLNRLENPRRMSIGTPVLIPVRHVPSEPDTSEPRASKTVVPADDAPSQAEAAASRTPAGVAAGPPRARTEELLDAVNAYLDGDFESALGRLEQLRQPLLEQGSAIDRTLLLKHLIFIYVAYDRTSDACDAYAALQEVDTPMSWDPDLVSPRVLHVIESCR